jgi:hypothetical protein
MMKEFYEVENLSNKLTGFCGENYEVVASLPESDIIQVAFSIPDCNIVNLNVDDFEAFHIIPALHSIGTRISHMGPVLLAPPLLRGSALSPRREMLFNESVVPVRFTVEYLTRPICKHEFTLSVLVASKTERDNKRKARIKKLKTRRWACCEQIRQIDNEVSTIQDSCSHVYRDFVCTICGKVATPGVAPPRMIQVCNNCHTTTAEKTCPNCGLKV